MKPRTRIAGIIIQDGKMLMLKGKGYKELWTPGGKIKERESDEECLRRELQEEIGVSLISLNFFGEYLGHSFYQPKIALTERVYLVTINGEIKPDAEIEDFIWLTKNDFATRQYLMIADDQGRVIPDLIKANVW